LGAAMRRWSGSLDHDNQREVTETVRCKVTNNNHWSMARRRHERDLPTSNDNAPHSIAHSLNELKPSPSIPGRQRELLPCPASPQNEPPPPKHRRSPATTRDPTRQHTATDSAAEKPLKRLWAQSQRRRRPVDYFLTDLPLRPRAGRASSATKTTNPHQNEIAQRFKGNKPGARHRRLIRAHQQTASMGPHRDQILISPEVPGSRGPTPVPQCPWPPRPRVINGFWRRTGAKRTAMTAAFRCFFSNAPSGAAGHPLLANVRALNSLCTGSDVVAALACRNFRSTSHRRQR